jgi:hypothetical protein
LPSRPSHQSRHHTEDLQAPSWANDRVGFVRGLQDETALFPVQVLHGECIVHNRHDDIADVGVGLLFDHDQVAFVDAGIDHRIALDAHEARFRRHAHEVVVDRHEVIAVAERRIGQARLHGIVGEPALEEPHPRLQLLVRRPVEVTGFLVTAHALRNPGLGGNAPQACQHRVRGNDLVLGVVVLELLEVARVKRGGLLFQRHGGFSVYRTIVR